MNTMKIKKYKNGSCSVTKVHVSFNFFQLLRVIMRNNFPCETRNKNLKRKNNKKIENK